MKNNIPKSRSDLLEDIIEKVQECELGLVDAVQEIFDRGFVHIVNVEVDKEKIVEALRHNDKRNNGTSSYYNYATEIDEFNVIKIKD